MTHTLIRRSRAARLGVAVLAFTLVGTLGCNEFLTADNPGAVEEPDVTNSAYAGLIANGPIYAYQFAYAENTYWNAQFTDELYNRAVFVEEGQIDRRELYSDMSYINAFMYAPMQRARFSGDDASARLKAILGDSASRDLRVARTLAYAGFSYIALGEMMCVTPIDLGVPKTSEEIFAGRPARHPRDRGRRLHRVLPARAGAADRPLPRGCAAGLARGTGQVDGHGHAQ